MTGNDLPGSMAATLARIEAGWATLWATLDRLDEGQLTGPTDAQGWTVKDHLTHLAAWERSMAYLLRGRPRHEGLGVPAALYLGDDVDATNAAIREREAGLSAAEARERLRDAHRQLLAALAPLTYDDLLKPYAHYLPDEPGDDDGRPIIGRVLGNSAEHYEEHLPWIAAIVGKAPRRV